MDRNSTEKKVNSNSNRIDDEITSRLPDNELHSGSDIVKDIPTCDHQGWARLVVYLRDLYGARLV